MKLILLIGIGGFFGSIFRYLLGGACQKLATGDYALFPIGTLMVNLVGCLAIGFLIPLMQERLIIPPEYRLALLVGLIGGFTTFSTYGYETLAMMLDGHWKYAIVNFTLSNFLGLLMVWAGYRLGQLI